LNILETGDGCTAIKLEGLSIDHSSILRIQGYRDLSAVRPAIQRAALSAARASEQLAVPSIFYRRLDVVECEGSSLRLEDGTLFENEAFNRFLARAKQVIVFVLTMGQDLDQSVADKIADDDLLGALFLEAAGWLGVEAATKVLSSHLRSLVHASNLKLSPRLGPGYSYKVDGRSVVWPLEQQQMLFKIFENDPINIRLFESCAMIPKLSRSGIYGLMPTS
jgi:hypothetical protein